jgi:hypothetical protein
VLQRAQEREWQKGRSAAGRAAIFILFYFMKKEKKIKN